MFLLSTANLISILEIIYFRKKGLRLRIVLPVATKVYCPMCLETAFISEELCMKLLVIVAAAEEKRGRIYSKGTLSHIALSRSDSISENRNLICNLA